MFKKILFPLDLTDNMYRVLPFVTEMADKFGAEIHCVYSLYVSSYYGSMGMGGTYIGEFEMNAQQEVKARTEKFISENLGGRNVEMSILNGRPGDEIVDYAQKNNIDLIIMGHSTTGIQRAVLGSVAAHVVKHSPSPVLVVSPEMLSK
jgi:nucleotide-binding universal stress UspA family protein